MCFNRSGESIFLFPNLTTLATSTKSYMKLNLDGFLKNLAKYTQSIALNQYCRLDKFELQMLDHHSTGI